jgi:hypothetical protein
MGAREPFGAAADRRVRMRATVTGDPVRYLGAVSVVERRSEQAPARACSRDRHPARPVEPKEEIGMEDILFVGTTVGFFVLTWALIHLCERL